MAIIYRLRDNINDNTYTNNPAASNYLNVRRSNFVATGDLQRNVLSLSIAADNADASPFTNYLSGGHGLGNVHLDVTDDVAGVIHFSGRMYNIKVNNTSIKMDFASPFSAKADAEGRKYQRTCPYYLYDQKTCTVKRSDVESSGLAFADAVTEIDDTVSVLKLTNIIAQPSIYANGSLMYQGLLFWIYSASSTHVLLRAPILHPSFAIGEIVTLYPACDKKLSTCTSLFKNEENFGGFPELDEVEALLEQPNEGKQANYSKDLIGSAEVDNVPDGEQYYVENYRKSLAYLEFKPEVTGNPQRSFMFNVVTTKERFPDLFTDAPPSAPSAPTVTATPSNNEIFISWTAATTGGIPTSWQIRVDFNDPPDHPWQTITLADANILAYTITTLSDGLTALQAETEYTIWVRGVNGVGDGDAAKITATTLAAPITAPDKPTNVAGSATDNSIALSWTAGARATSHEVQIDGGAWITAASNTSHTFTNLVGNSSYFVSVRAVNADGMSDSVLISVTTLYARPLLTLVSATDTTIVIQVVNAETGVAEVRLGGGTWSRLSGTSRHTFTGLDASTTYTIEAQTLIAVGSGTVYSVIATLQVTTALAAPSNLVGSYADPNLTLEWDEDTNATSWEVHITKVGSSATSEWTETDTVLVSNNTRRRYSVNWSLIIAAIGTGDYLARVRGVNSVGNGAESSVTVTVT